MFVNFFDSSNQIPSPPPPYLFFISPPVAQLTADEKLAAKLAEDDQQLGIAERKIEIAPPPKRTKEMTFQTLKAPERTEKQLLPIRQADRDRHDELCSNLADDTQRINEAIILMVDASPSMVRNDSLKFVLLVSLVTFTFRYHSRY